MAVYREGYSIINELLKQSKRIYPDACDFGVPVKKGDSNFNSLKQLTEWYGIKRTRVQNSCGVSQKIELLDEWAVSDGRKTVAEARDIYLVEYVNVQRQKDFDGIITVTKL